MSTTIKLIIPNTSLEGNQEHAVIAAIKLLRSEPGIVVEQFNTDLKPIDLDPEAADAPDPCEIEVCDPHTVCAETCQSLPDCQKP